MKRAYRKKSPYTVWLDPRDADWAREQGDDISSGIRKIIKDYRIRETNRRNGVLKRRLKRLPQATADRIRANFAALSPDYDLSKRPLPR
jgi:hypothetical protein